MIVPITCNMRTILRGVYDHILKSISALSDFYRIRMHRQAPGSNRDNRWVAETLSIVRELHTDTEWARKQCSDNSDKVGACPRICIAPPCTNTSTHTNAATAKGQIGTCVIGQVTKLNGS